MLNRVWLVMILASFATALAQWLFIGDSQSVNGLVAAMFDSASLAVEIALGLIGVLCLWQGLFAIAEKCGAVAWLAKKVTPLFQLLMPGIPKGDPAFGSVTMNLAANALGLDNAATPLGIRAMQDLQKHNPTPDTASDAQILFLVLNTSSVTLIPITVFLYRAQQGAEAPADVFLPILLATTASTIGGLLIVSLVQRINLLQRQILMAFALVAALILALIGYLMQLSASAISEQSTLMANLLLVAFIAIVLLLAQRRQVAVYDEFIEGAKQGFETAIRLIPFLVAMLVALAMLRASGLLAMVVDGLAWLVAWFGGDTSFVEAMPVAFAKPFSGSAARALLIDTMHVHGADSFVGRLASIFQGSTETTFYVLAVYFGAVGIRNSRYALWCGLFADAVGIIAAIFIAYWFYG
ncbi:membrane protein [Neiella marina]|uniref:Membrane protein n=1 Tax=Neiella marina TaxID=508461 RepID=A0A8J2U354_9GAMM|nr:spore maturation protein [Neiella marina]GGA69908.1 membrane protein [Neiella marina]